MSHPAYKLPLRFVLRLRLQKGGGVFVGHYGITLYSNSMKTGARRLEEFLQRRLTVCEKSRLASQNPPRFWIEMRVTRFPWHTATKLLRATLK